MRWFFLISIFMMVGCATVEFVRKDFVPHKQGVLRHAVPSSSDSEVKYRDEVNKQSRAFCGGDFSILKEYQALDAAPTSTGIATGYGFGRNSSMIIGGVSQNQIMYSFVEFTCK